MVQMRSKTFEQYKPRSQLYIISMSESSSSLSLISSVHEIFTNIAAPAPNIFLMISPTVLQLKTKPEPF